MLNRPNFRNRKQTSTSSAAGQLVLDTLSSNLTIPDHYQYIVSGPFTINLGVTLTIIGKLVVI